MTSLRELLAERACVGTFVKIPRPEVVDIVASAGFDFLVCDMEHAQMDESAAGIVIAAARSHGLPVVVRLPDPTQGLVNRLLEAGAEGIQMPRVRSAADSAALLSCCRFPPDGARSIGRANRAAGYGSVPIGDYLSSQNERILTVGQFETRSLADSFDEVTHDLGVAFVGPTDLSVDFGTPDDIASPAIQEYLSALEQAALRNGTLMGVFVATADQGREFMGRGYRYIVLSGDVTMLGIGARQTRSTVLELRNL